MHKHNYLFFDCTYYLTRNSYTIKGDPSVSVLLGSILISLNKIQKELQARKIFLIFDKGPYKKKLLIDSYKADRVKASEEIVKIEDKLKTETDPEKIKELENQLEIQKRNDKLFQVRAECKYELLCNGASFGLVPFQYQGFECDDLARFFSKLTSDENHKSDLPNVIVSSDGDWISFTDRNCNNYRSIKYPKYYTYEDSVNFIPEKFRDNITPFEYKQLISLYSGNHDNIRPIRISSELSLDQFLQKYVTKELFEDDEFNHMFNALYIEKYYDDIKGDLEKTLNLGKLSKSNFYKFKNRLGIRVYPGVINNLFESLDPSAYIEEFSIYD